MFDPCNQSIAPCQSSKLNELPHSLGYSTEIIIMKWGIEGGSSRLLSFSFPVWLVLKTGSGEWQEVIAPSPPKKVCEKRNFQFLNSAFPCFIDKILSSESLHNTYFAFQIKCSLFYIMGIFFWPYFNGSLFQC